MHSRDFLGRDRFLSRVISQHHNIFGQRGQIAYGQFGLRLTKFFPAQVWNFGHIGLDETNAVKGFLEMGFQVDKFFEQLGLSGIELRVGMLALVVSLHAMIALFDFFLAPPADFNALRIFPVEDFAQPMLEEKKLAPQILAGLVDALKNFSSPDDLRLGNQCITLDATTRAARACAQIRMAWLTADLSAGERLKRFKRKCADKRATPAPAKRATNKALSVPITDYATKIFSTRVRRDARS
jgi:hypothetical protein